MTWGGSAETTTLMHEGFQPTVTEARPVSDDDVRLASVWSVLVERKLIIGLSIALCTIIALFYALTAPAYYRAEVLLIPANTDAGTERWNAVVGQLGSLGSLVGFGAPASRSEEVVARLRSRAFTEDFIRQEGLLPLLFSKRWDATAERWLPQNPGLLKRLIEALDPFQDPPKVSADPPTMWSAVGRFWRIRSVETSRDSLLIKLAIEWTDPAEAAQWANRMVAQINETSRQIAINESERRLVYLNAQKEKTASLEMRELIFRLIESELKTVMIANAAREFSLKTVDPAVAPEQPSGPNRPLIVFGGILSGLVFGVIIALFQVLRRNRSARQEARTDAP